MGRTMDLNELGGVPGGASGALGAIVAAIGGAIWLVRKVWRSDRVEGARSQAETDIIERLQDLLDKANARADSPSSARTWLTRSAMTRSGSSARWRQRSLPSRRRSE